MCKSLFCSKKELIKMFKNKELTHFNSKWLLKNLEVKIIAIYDNSLNNIKNINEAQRYKIDYVNSK